MIQIIVNSFIEQDKNGATVENLSVSAVHGNVQTKRDELAAQYPENYLAICDLSLATILNELPRYPFVFIGKEEFK